MVENSLLAVLVMLSFIVYVGIGRFATKLINEIINGFFNNQGNYHGMEKWETWALVFLSPIALALIAAFLLGVLALLFAIIIVATIICLALLVVVSFFAGLDSLYECLIGSSPCPEVLKRD